MPPGEDGERAERSRRRAQLAFLVSLFVTLIVTPIWLGVAALGAVVSVVSTALLIVNLLISSREDPNPLLQRVQTRLSHIGQLRIFAAVMAAAAVVTTILAIGSAYRRYERRFQLTVSGFVQRADGSPATNCYVTPDVSPESVDVSAPTGAFELRFDRRRIAQGKFRVDAKCGAESAFARVRTASAGKPLFLRLSRRIPLPVKYVPLTGSKFEKVARLDGSLRDEIGGDFQLVPTKTYKAVQRIAESFKTPDGRRYAGADGDPFLVDVVFEEGLTTLRRPDVWYALQEHDVPGTLDPAERIVFRRFVRVEDLAKYRYQQPLVDLYLALVGNRHPPDLGYVQLYFESRPRDECAGPYGLLEAVAVPLVAVQLAVIENPGPGMVRIGKLTYRENEGGLRRESVDRAQLAARPRITQRIVASGFLPAGKRIVIPIAITLQARGADLLERSYEPVAPDVLAAALGPRDAFRYEVVSSSSTIVNSTLEGDLVRAVAERPLPDFETRYRIGPSLDLETIEINDVAYDIEGDEQRPEILMAWGGTTSSCPYVFTFDRQRGQWVDRGVILAGRSGVSRRGSDTITVPEFDGRVLLRELEREDSYIDQLTVTVVDAGGRTDVLLPLHDELRETDGRFLVLHHGQSSVIRFDCTRSGCSGAATISATGFYVPRPGR